MSDDSYIFFIPEGVEFFNQFLIFVFLVAIVLEISYIILPQTVKRMVETIDFDKSKNHSISYSGAAAILLLIGLLITQGQNFS